MRAAALISARRQGVHFVIIGEDKSPQMGYRRSLESLIAELGLSGIVAMQGWRDDIPALALVAYVVCLRGALRALRAGYCRGNGCGAADRCGDVRGCTGNNRGRTQRKTGAQWTTLKLWPAPSTLYLTTLSSVRVSGATPSLRRVSAIP